MPPPPPPPGPGCLGEGTAGGWEAGGGVGRPVSARLQLLAQRAAHVQGQLLPLRRRSAPVAHKVERQQEHVVVWDVRAAPLLDRLSREGREPARAGGRAAGGRATQVGHTARAHLPAGPVSGKSHTPRALCKAASSQPARPRLACSLSSEREDRMRRAPAAAQCRASASPSPWLAPTTHTNLPCHAPAGGSRRDSSAKSASALQAAQGRSVQLGCSVGEAARRCCG